MRHSIVKAAGIALLACSTGLWAGGGKPVESHRVSYVSKENFDTVKAAITDSIAGKGLVINTTSHIGDMLERTGKDLGNAKPIFSKAESFEFCSATVSRLTMEADPHNIVFCPYIISVYVLANEPAKTYVSFRKPQAVNASKASASALKEIEKLLRGIIEEAIQ